MPRRASNATTSQAARVLVAMVRAPSAPPLWIGLMLALLPACSDVEQGPECRAFVACVKEADAVRGTVTNVDRFQPNGACWGGEKGAAVCESACRRGVPALRAQEPRVVCASGEGAR